VFPSPGSAEVLPGATVTSGMGVGGLEDASGIGVGALEDASGMGAGASAVVIAAGFSFIGPATGSSGGLQSVGAGLLGGREA